MERDVKEVVKLTPRNAKLGVVCNLTLPTLDVHNFVLEMPEKEEEKRDSTDDYRKSRTKIAQNRSAQKGLF